MYGECMIYDVFRPIFSHDKYILLTFELNKIKINTFQGKIVKST
jgi:hypothetical protein